MIGVKPVTKEIIQAVLVPEINGLDANLAKMDTQIDIYAIS
ncbi:hypothetical protein ACWNT8_13190 [Pigmentibacter ruber]|nr:hypothetical protein GTC16762_13590 [Pigmentibacter ruber]